MESLLYRLEDIFEALAEDSDWWLSWTVMVRLSMMFAALGDACAMQVHHRALLLPSETHQV